MGAGREGLAAKEWAVKWLAANELAAEGLAAKEIAAKAWPEDCTADAAAGAPWAVHPGME